MECKHCHETHNFLLEIRYIPADNPDKLILFGGKQFENSVNLSNYEVVLTCPNEKKIFAENIRIKPEKKEQIVGIIASDSLEFKDTEEKLTKKEVIEFIKSSLTTSDSLEFKDTEEKLTKKEVMEFVKSSLDIARDFCKNMLTISLGAIPLFFAVLKYLGSESANSVSMALTGLIPVSLFLISAIFYVIGLRPQVYTFENPTEEFTTFYNQRHISMNKYILAGTVLFILGVSISILIFIKMQIYH